MLLLAELIDAERERRERVKQEELRLLKMLMQEEAPVSGGCAGLQPSENAFSADQRSSRKGSKGKGKGPDFRPSQGAEQPELQVSFLTERLRRAISAKNWAEVNMLINSPEQVWLLACSERGSRQLQQLLSTSSDTEQAAFKSAVDKVILGLQSHVLEATASNGTWNYSNYVLQALIQALPVERFTFILEEMKTQVVNVALDPQGCRVLQRLLEHTLHDEERARSLLEELKPEIKRVALDRYGNHVMQKLVEMATGHQKLEISQAFLDLAQQPGELREMAVSKYSSFVLQKVIRECGSYHDQQRLLAAVEMELEAKTPQSGRKAKKSEYGSFVARTVRETKSGIQGGPEQFQEHHHVSTQATMASQAIQLTPHMAAMAQGWYSPHAVVFAPIFPFMPPPDFGHPYAVHPTGMWQGTVNH